MYMPNAISNVFHSEPAFRDDLRDYYFLKFNKDILGVDLDNVKQIDDIFRKVILYRYEELDRVFPEAEKESCISYLKNIVNDMQRLKSDSINQQNIELERSGGVDPLEI